MTNNLFQKRFSFFLFLFILTGCGVSSSPVSQSDTADITGAGGGSGTIVVSVDLPSLDLRERPKAALEKHTSVTGLSATVANSSGLSATQNLTVSNNTATGAFTQLPVGTYNVSISVFAETELLGTGTSTAIVSANTTTTASVVVTVPPDETGSLAVNVTVIEGTSTLIADNSDNGFGLYDPRNNQLQYPNETVITNFQSGHGFIKQSAAGTQSDDTINYIKGNQSLKLVTDGLSSAVFTRRSSISPTLDLTNKYLKVWVKVDNTSECTRFLVLCLI